MTFQGSIDQLAGREVYGSDGHRIGGVGQVFVLDGTDEPTWITVRTGLFGMHESFIPVADATERGDELVVPYEKAFVQDAPRIDDASELSVEQEAELYRYYGVEPPMQQRAAVGEHQRDAGDLYAGSGHHDQRGEHGVGGHLRSSDERHSGDADDSGPSTAHADRTPYGGGHDAGSAESSGSGSDDERGIRGRDSADQGSASSGGASSSGSGGPRLRRRIVTEMQTIQVPVQREEIVVEGDGIEPGGDDRR